MTIKAQGVSDRTGASAFPNEQIPDDIQESLAFAEEALRKDRTRMSKQAQLVAFSAALSQIDIHRVLKVASTEFLTSFFLRIPDFSGSLTLWSEEYFKSPDQRDIVRDLQRLHSLGVRREPVAVAMQAVKFSSFLDNSFAQFGNKRQRRQQAKRLLTPVQELRDFAKLFGDPPALVYKLIPNPAKIAVELELLCSILNWGVLLYESLGVNHFLEASKFGLASLVREKTGMFLDREVSNLISMALGNYNYDETRHRVWRIDNYERLQRNAPIVTRSLLALNSLDTLAENQRNS
jgi:hypothetical protein